MQHWAGGQFDVLTSGQLPPNPSELLASQHMRALLTELRASYDLVLIDTPPLLPVTDAAAVAPATDGVILVCRFKETTRTQVESAAGALRAVSAPLLGTVFSMVPSTGPPGLRPVRSSYHRTEAPSCKVNGAVRAPSPGRRRPSPTPGVRS